MKICEKEKGYAIFNKCQIIIRLKIYFRYSYVRNFYYSGDIYYKIIENVIQVEVGHTLIII